MTWEGGSMGVGVSKWGRGGEKGSSGGGGRREGWVDGGRRGSGGEITEESDTETAQISFYSNGGQSQRLPEAFEARL